MGMGCRTTSRLTAEARAEQSVKRPLVAENDAAADAQH